MTIFGLMNEHLDQVQKMRSIYAKHSRPDIKAQIRQGPVVRLGPRTPQAVILDTPYSEKRPFAAIVDRVEDWLSSAVPSARA